MKPINANRLLSLDAFRGMTIASMIVVNNPGIYCAVNHQLHHAAWNGWTFTDTIFPSFLFIMGMSLVFSFNARNEKGISNSGMGLRIIRRASILFALGIFLNLYPEFNFSVLRIPGVLQRIALCYLFASLIVISAGTRGRVLWLIGLLGSYWLLMRYFPVPVIGSGVLEPGANFAAWVDSLLLKGHMWPGPWDPEGIMSTIPAIGTALFGVLAADFLLSPFSNRHKTAGMLAGAIALIVLGVILSRWMPINKNLWTSTYSIFMAGCALLGFALCYWIIDAMEYKKWAAAFMIFGMNPLAIYFLSQFLTATLGIIDLRQPDGSTISLSDYLFGNCFARFASPGEASFLFAFAFILVMFIIAWAMWRKRIFVKI